MSWVIFKKTVVTFKHRAAYVFQIILKLFNSKISNEI